MIPKECKRLAEVDFPIAVVSRHSARENAVRHGHPKALHLWWARRPLAACRAMLLALLLPDPCDQNCAAEFKNKARALLLKVQGSPGPKDIDLQKALLRFIGDFANWDLAANPRYQEVGRGLVRAAHGEETPLVVDPFAGGGSIPLEALRLGCDAFASDLNPVACLILKVMLEDIPRHGPKLAEELRRVGTEIKKQAEKELAQYYPPDPDGATPIAYLWARTVRCESPNCGAEIPLLRSFWLCKKASRLRALRYEVNRPKGKPPYVEFEVYTPTGEKDVPAGTVTRAKATCLACERVLAPDRVRAQLREQQGGADATFDAEGKRVGGAFLLAVATVKNNAAGRHYRVAIERDYRAIWAACARLSQIADHASPGDASIVPNEPIPRTELRRISLPIYGVERFRDMFTARQLLTLSTLAQKISERGSEASSNTRLLSLCLGKTADLNNANTPWKPDAECPVHTLARHDIPAAWDFAEALPLGDASGSFLSAYERTAASIAPAYVGSDRVGTVQSADACLHPLPDASAAVWFTDPPYYDSVPYAHLSDFFYVWEKRASPESSTNDHTSLTPKDRELVVDRAHSAIPDAKTPEQFERRMAIAMSEGARIVKDDGVAAVVFAHKTTEGWEALLSGMVAGGWVITNSWPIITEMQARLNARENASLAASVHLVCRPRPAMAHVGDWSTILRELPNRIGDWMGRLSAEGVRGADLVFACIGPAMELYSRYSKVEDAQGREIPLGGDPEAVEPYKRGFLAYVWETVGRIALEQILGTAEARARNGAAGALEEDARLTALFLWTIQSTATNGVDAESDEEDESEDEDEEAGAGKSKKGLTLVYDVARRFAQPLGIHLDRWEDRIIATEKGIVRLLPVTDRAEQLLGEDGAIGAADLIERTKGKNINYEFAFATEPEDRPSKTKPSTRKAGAVRDEAPAPKQGTTTLDHVHIAMLLQKSGKSNALRTMLKSEIEQGPDFLRLSNALSALYPKDSEEKRLLDAMLLAMPR